MTFLEYRSHVFKDRCGEHDRKFFKPFVDQRALAKRAWVPPVVSCEHSSSWAKVTDQWPA